MLRFITVRLLSSLPTIFIVLTLSFFMIRIAPGGPFNLERPLDPAVLANMKAVYNLDQPVWLQYLYYIGNVLRGDFGPSYIYKDYTVAELILQALPYSIVLGLWALSIAVIGGVIMGVYAALRQNSWVDYILTTGANWAEPIGEFRLVVD
ncbi:MAG: DUF4424 domain-containing protein, partial [Rhizobiaceae bacterium]